MKFLRYLLFPFSILYAGLMSIRNRYYDDGRRPITVFEKAVISVGNLSTGGTGKTPLIEYLIRLLKDEYSIATISRGYGRKTKGVRIASKNDSSRTLGDEPFQFYRKFGSEIEVVVGEERIMAIPELLIEKPDIQLFLLDDAYQHRKAGRDIDVLLTDFSKPFFQDYVLPTGNLREKRNEAHRANCIIVTKCPSLSRKEKAEWKMKIAEYNKDAPVFFSNISYSDLEPVFNKAECENDIAIIVGIADPEPFYKNLEKGYNIIEKFEFIDHYNFKSSDLDRILRKLNNKRISLVVTEKDMVRLLEFEDHPIFKKYSLFYQPIMFELDEQEKFDQFIIEGVEKRLRELND